MLTKSTARYFAKQAYQLRLMTGRYSCTFRQGAIKAEYRPAYGTVHVWETAKPTEMQSVKVAKCWAQL